MEKENYSLLAHNTFGIDVKAKRFIEYSSEEELKGLIDSGAFSGKYLHIGAGSNLLFTKDFDGTVFHSNIKGITEVQFDGYPNPIYAAYRVGAGETWDDFVEFCVEHELYGAENLSHIPGEVGAAAVQNIGAYGTEICEIICGVDAYDTVSGVKRTFDIEELEYDYRMSVLKRPEMKRYIVTSVTFGLMRAKHFNFEYKALKSAIDALGKEPTLRLVRDTIVDIRKSKLPEPEDTGSAGSFFMNPVVDEKTFSRIEKAYPNLPYYKLDDNIYKIPAGWLIDQSGWKGKTMGHAGVYDKQALVLVNRGGATGGEVLALAKAIVESVVEKFGPEFELHPEVNIF
jgi:UDP-N-acetylmuramate dehydrogenase